MSVFGEPTARERLVWRVRDQIRRLAVDGFAASEVQVPIGETTMTRPTLDDPLAGVRAADLVQRAAAAQRREYATEARAAGRSWDEVADALGLTDLNEADVLAFEEVAGDCTAFSGGRVWWRCGSCGQRITDTGPFTTHPADIEAGHGPLCARHAADIAEWEQEQKMGWQD